MKKIFFSLMVFSFITSFLSILADDDPIATQESILKEQATDYGKETIVRERKKPKGKKGKGKKILIPEEDILLNLDGKQRVESEETDN